ncbi:phosphatidate cytidylyltransferase [Cystoisospora suis]|uniref:Phosphatidate cytidylyltransferase n=1 Tax=Cystoisospora suis TaxID=483139 RepID=A0A2C6KI34_9APIC|nr:phosphatidate cytidylyltransferase [Cystoisospora suis]
MASSYTPTMAGAEVFGHFEVAPFSGSKAAPKSGPIAAAQYQREVVNNAACMVGVIVLLAVFQFTPKNKLSDFAARKLTHLSMGTLLLFMEPNGHPYLKIFVVAVAAGAVLSCVFKPLRFAQKYDKGIILFNVLVAVWALLDLPFAPLAPMFYADPCAAIVGTTVESRKWYKNKTIAGSAAVFVVTLLTAFTVDYAWHRLAIAALCTLLEALGGDYDNLLMSIPVIGYFLIFQYSSGEETAFGGLSFRGGWSSEAR